MKKWTGWMMILAAVMLLAVGALAEETGLTPPVINGVQENMKLEVGHSLDFLVSVDENTFELDIEIKDAEGDTVYGADYYNRRSCSIHIDEGIFDPGTYTLIATAYDRDRNHEDVEVEFEVTGQRSPAPEVSIPESVTLDEYEDFVFTLEGITEVRYRDDEDEYILKCNSLIITETGGNWSYLFSSAGEHTFMFSAKVNGIWTAWTDPMIVSVIPRGTLGPAQIDMKTEYLAGEPISVDIIGCEHADTYTLRLDDEYQNLLNRVTAGKYAALPTGLDAGNHRIRVTAYGNGYLSSEESVFEFYVTGERPAAPTVSVPEGRYRNGDYRPVFISADNIQGAAEIQYYRSYDISVDTYLASSGTAVVPVKVYSWSKYYCFRALINGLWSEKSEEVLISAEVNPEGTDYPAPEFSFNPILEQGQPLEVTIDSIPNGAEYYAYTVAWRYGSGEYDVENIFYEHVFDPAGGTLIIPEYAFPYVGQYNISLMAYMEDGYCDAQEELTVNAGSDPLPGPVVTMLTEQPMVYDDIQFLVETGGAEKLSVMVREREEYNPVADPEIIELNPEDTSFIYTYRADLENVMKISFSLYNGSSWSAYSDPLEFEPVRREAYGEIIVNSVSWPDDVVKGESITITWDIENEDWLEYSVYKLENDENDFMFGGRLDSDAESVTFDTSDWPEAGIYTVYLQAYVPGYMKDIFVGDYEDRIRIVVRDGSAPLVLTAENTETEEGAEIRLTVNDPGQHEYLMLRANGETVGYQYKGADTDTYTVSWTPTQRGFYTFDVCGMNTDKSMYTVWSNSVTVASGVIIRIDETNFPDAAFRNFILENGYDQNGDGMLTGNELSAVTQMDCSNRGIADMTGIGCFFELTNLNCDGNRLTELDLSGNQKLADLSCSRNQLSALDLSGNPMMQRIECADNQLTALDLSGMESLERIDCSDNRLTELTLSGNPALTEIDCSENQLTSLDLCDTLEILNCSNNQLSSLDISNRYHLSDLDCRYNQLTELDINNSGISVLRCEGNRIKTLDFCKRMDLVDFVLNEAHIISEGDVREYYWSSGTPPTLSMDHDTELILIDEENALRLPEGLTEIKSEAFVGTAATEIVIPRSVTYIAQDAFNSDHISIFGYANTEAETFAKENEYDFYKLGN